MVMVRTTCIFSRTVLILSAFPLVLHSFGMIGGIMDSGTLVVESWLVILMEMVRVTCISEPGTTTTGLGYRMVRPSFGVYGVVRCLEM